LREAILLDALGTLVALEPPAPHLARALGTSLADAERAIAAEIAYYRTHLDEGRDPASLAALRKRCTAALGAELPAVTLDPELLEEVLLASLRFTAFPDAAPALGALRAAGTRLVVVSNWDVSLREVLSRVGLAGLLDDVITSAEVGARKPAREIFERAGPARLHVGDSLDEDVAGARAAGIEPVLIRRDGSPGPPGVRTITTLGELVAGP
jgi:putative hydrolase of the HAD superfamily